jgi:predicted O-methyltransferase YrrM
LTERVRDENLIATENRRLHKENAQLEERIQAFESSRWWRLHPRLRLHDVRRLLTGTSADAPAGDAETEIRRRTSTADDADDSLARHFATEVAARGDFTADWFTRNISSLEPILRELEGRSAAILEIGSFEGMSACYFLWRLREARLTCVDTFDGSTEHIAYGDLPPELEQRFTTNVALVDAARVRMLRGESRRVLTELLDAGDQFDLVYVDGSHLALDVLVDAGLSWGLLRSGGVIVFDDYGWHMLGYDRLLRPGPAIDAFVALVADHSETLLHDRQVAIRKLS